MAFNPDQYLAEKAAQPSFDPDAYLAQKSPEQDPSELESAVRGAGTGVSLGFEPAIAGAGSAGMQALKDAVLSGKVSIDDIKKNYQSMRNSENKRNDLAQKTNPLSSLAGNVVGGGALALGTGGAGLLPEAAEGAGLGARAINATKVGALAGGASGLGNSVSSGNDLPQTAQNVAGGAALGSLAGPAAEVGLTGLKAAASPIANGLNRVGSAITDEVGSSPQLDNFKKAFNYGRMGINTNSKAGAQAAQSGIEDAAEALGLGARDLNKQAGAQVGAAKQALQDSGNTFNATPTLEKIQAAIAKAKTSSNPNAEKDAAFLQKYYDNLVGTNNTPNGPVGINPDAVDFNTANDINKTLTDFGGVSGNGPDLKTTDALNSSKLAAQDLKSQMTGAVPNGTEGPISQLGDANQKASASYKALNALGVDDSSFETNPLTGEKQLTPQGEAKLSNTVRQVGKGSDSQAGQNASSRLNTSLDYLKAIDPDKAASLQGQVQQAGDVHNLVQQAQGNSFTKSGLLQSLPIKGGNFLGRLVSTPTNTLEGAVNAGSKSASGASKQVSTAIQPLTDTAFSDAAKQLNGSGTGVGMKLGSELAKGIGKNSSQKNAILFSLMQQPQYREALQNHFSSQDNE